MECIFCRIIAGEIPSHKVYEDDETVAFLDINPSTRGHTLVVSKHHAPDLVSLPPEALCAVARTTQHVARILYSVVQPDGLNVLQNNGTAAGQGVFHYHVHLLPRWAGDQAVRLGRPGETDHAALSALVGDLRAAERTS
jgi:histidine triad (HIT) family protein